MAEKCETCKYWRGAKNEIEIQGVKFSGVCMFDPPKLYSGTYGVQSWSIWHPPSNRDWTCRHHQPEVPTP